MIIPSSYLVLGGPEIHELCVKLLAARGLERTKDRAKTEGDIFEFGLSVSLLLHN